MPHKHRKPPITLPPYDQDLADQVYKSRTVIINGESIPTHYLVAARLEELERTIEASPYLDAVILARQVHRYRAVLVRQIGDHRKCPECGHTFVPMDSTSQEAIDAIK